MDTYWPGNVLDLLLAHILEREGELVAYLITHHPADTDPPGLGQGLEPCRDIDPIAIDIEPVLHNVAEIDPHAELDAAIRRHVGVSLCHLALHFDGATHRVDDAGKLDEQTVARGLHDATAMFLDFRIRQLAPNRLQPRKGALFVRAHKPRVARHIGGENGGQPAFDAFRGQSGAPQPHGPNKLSALGAHSNGKRDVGHSPSVRYLLGFAFGAAGAFARMALSFAGRW